MSKVARIQQAREFAFDGNLIRTAGTDRDLWFVAKDVCEALGISWRGSDSLSVIPEEWKGVRNLRTPQRNSNGTISLPFQDHIVINEAGVYKLAFRSNKPQADAFTNWVASEVLPAIRKTGTYLSKRRQKYEALGKSPEWIAEREEGIEDRKSLTEVLQIHEATDYAGCTNAIYRPVLGGSAAIVKTQLQLKPKVNLRDHLSTVDLMKVKFAEVLAGERIQTDDLRGNDPCKSACRVAGEAVVSAVEAASKTSLN